MTTRDDKPTENEYQSAIQKAKDPPHKVTSTDIKTTDEGAGLVRHYLTLENPRWAVYPLDSIRKDVTNLSRRRKEPGSHKRTDEQRTASWLRTLKNAWPTNGQHSANYDEIHNCPEYKMLKRTLMELLGYRCQLCARVFHGMDLEAHIVDYILWNKPGMMLILCKDECHPVADSLRRRGKTVDSGAMPLFAGIE